MTPRKYSVSNEILELLSPHVAYFKSLRNGPINEFTKLPPKKVRRIWDHLQDPVERSPSFRRILYSWLENPSDELTQDAFKSSLKRVIKREPSIAIVIQEISPSKFSPKVGRLAVSAKEEKVLKKTRRFVRGGSRAAVLVWGAKMKLPKGSSKKFTNRPKMKSRMGSSIQVISKKKNIFLKKKALGIEAERSQRENLRRKRKEVERLLFRSTKVMVNDKSTKIQNNKKTMEQLPENVVRVVNLCFTNLDQSSVLKKNMNLAKDERYFLRVNIGPQSEANVTQDPEPIDPSLQEISPSSQGYWLDVLVISDDFKVSTNQYRIYLPKIGSSWICSCRKGKTHNCQEDERKPYLFIPVQAPSWVGMAELRLAIYYKNNLVQSLLLSTTIVKEEALGIGHFAIVDYRLKHNLKTLGSFKQRGVNVLTNMNQDGTHHIVIKGEKKTLILHLTEGQMKSTMEAFRETMFDVQYKENWRKTKISTFDKENAKSKQDCINDLEGLARRGLELWQMLFKDEDQSGVKEQFKQATTIQISRVANSEFVVPWGWVYDIDLETNVKPKYCKVLEDWDGKSPIIPANQHTCNYEHPVNTLCPFGFWGFRHVIEQPPSLSKNRNIVQVIKTVPPLELVIGRSLELDSSISQSHIDALKNLLPGYDIQDCIHWEKLRDELGRIDLELVYFYCHGIHQDMPNGFSKITNLLVGKDEKISPTDIPVWQRNFWSPEHWIRTSPLVFINGCHTVDISLDTPVNFVDMFTNAHASGVIGTEATISQNVASEAASKIFEGFIQRKLSIGEAIRQMRIDMLSKGNVLGLMYTIYCSADLKMV